jgi:hypothetical protein
MRGNPPHHQTGDADCHENPSQQLRRTGQFAPAFVFGWQSAGIGPPFITAVMRAPMTLIILAAQCLTDFIYERCLASDVLVVHWFPFVFELSRFQDN